MFVKKICILLICFTLMSCSFNTTTKENINEDDNATIETSEPAKIISAFGDSITAGYGIDIEDAYPSQLQEKIIQEGYFDYKVVNNGVSGETTEGGRSRVNWILKQNPEIAIFVLGGNDMLRGLSPDETYQNLSETIEILQENNVKVLLGGMQALDNLGVDYVNQFNPIYPRLVEEYDLAYIPFFLEGVALDPQYNLADGIHPNKEGYTIIVENLWQYLEPLLEK